MEILNAKIRSADIGFEDHGILTMFLDFSHEKGQQGLPCYNLSEKFVRDLLQTIGINSLSKLKGAPVRLKLEDGLIVAVGHFIDDKWFIPSESVKR